MGFLRCDSDSLSKPVGRRPDEKKDRTEKSKGGVGERKPSPFFHHPNSSALSVSKIHNVIKMEVDFGLFTIPRVFVWLWKLYYFFDSSTALKLCGVQKNGLQKLSLRAAYKIK